uniref:Coiled-coil domain containing 28A n=1 Tax=Cyclopterus lumpus TaxID=8103 RepID=A0A8C2X139_CYCLU
MDTAVTSTPPPVKRWQLGGTRSGTRFSTWTPLNHRAGNLQLFEERTNLVLHWFDLWTDGQRKHLLHSLLTQCSRSQLKYCKDLLAEAVPVTRVDFTSVLPRFLSLYVMSFLSPRDLCSAAQVSWHWGVLAEQDCLWAGRCIRRGWFLPYTPGEKESGAWKNHYVSCVSTLDRLTPREAAERYGTLNQRSAGETEEEEERRKERRIRQTIRDKLQEEKSDSVINPVFGILNFKMCCSSMGPLRPRERLSEARGALSSFTGRPLPPNVSVTPPPLVLLISSRIPAYELVLSGVKDGVVAVLYDHRGTLSALLTQVERTISGQRAQRLGLLAPGGTEEIHLLHGCGLSERTLLTPDHREFWEKLCGWLAPTEEGGGIDIFSPLAASALMQTLSTLTGLEVLAPMGFATGSFQNSESHLDGGGSGAAEGQLGATAPERQPPGQGPGAGWVSHAPHTQMPACPVSCKPPEESIHVFNIGHFLWEKIRLEELCVSKDVNEALAEGLAALTRQEEVGQQGEFVSRCLIDWITVFLWFCSYVFIRFLPSLKVYQEPLTAALNSNRAILSYADIHVVLSPVAQLLELNRAFQEDLRARLQQWGAEQCVGDVLVKLCSKLRVYTNYLNNYTTALRTVDKCRETKPPFRAFLKRADRTLATHMLSLQELLLCPVWRIQEYVTLLQVLSSHTHSRHPDHTHLRSALDTLLGFREFIQKRNSERDERMEETEKMIQGCPSLSEGNRQLIITQDAALLMSPDEKIPDSLRVYEQVSDVGLFLFNDALVLTRRRVQHTPFSPAHRSAHTFLASVALASLAVREITHTRYVRHAFVLEGPCRSWVCATERGEEREHFLCALRSAVTNRIELLGPKPD